ncbi:type II toxin-antitoxin system Phd/YefM family antitoxin [Pseudidiomarina aquimaris]|uniref:Antitoxin n=1 Tax=Pseudidiomarina aquimaris TaxID=641841 RepID=A0A432XFW7_9GAMM|nr:type II toxin-antitoxin system Phd/YefM family antitoxin [Pseudidiomarina aquimaris]RUO47644.1 type II toxin-antitoxin system prevent-host-death family antitoxin [Pseudidiomarina aquimaris]|tara:strand:- start:1419 stop:1676 length:258 start_codon:yes stop_codon:yes gene_type:complete
MKVELVTQLKRQATAIIAELQRSKEPVLITEHGKPAAYLVDVEEYQAIQRRLDLLDALAQGERAIADDRVVNQEKAKERLQRWLK